MSDVDPTSDGLSVPPSLRVPRWGIWDAVITILGAFVLAVIALVVLAVTDAPLPVALIFGTAAPWIALAGWPLFVTRWRGNGARIDLALHLSWREAGWGAIGGVVALIVGMVVAGLTTVVFGEFDSAAGEAAMELKEAGPAWAVLIFALMIAVGAPFVEELAFRGMLYSSLMKKGLGVFWSIGISAVVFGLFHFEVQRIAVLVAIGIVLGVVRWRTNSLGSAMLAHAVNNLPGAILILFAS